jgi:hypothetical protein
LQEVEKKIFKQGPQNDIEKNFKERAELESMSKEERFLK